MTLHLISLTTHRNTTVEHAEQTEAVWLDCAYAHPRIRPQYTVIIDWSPSN